MTPLVRILAAVLALWSLSAIGQTPASRAAGAWMCPCPGRQVPLGAAGSCSAACFGGRAGAGIPGMAAQQQFAQQIGGLLGNMLLESLFRNPEQEAQQRAAEEAAARAQEAELRRLAAEEERRKDAMRDRLLAMMIGVGQAPALAPIVDSQAALQPILGDASVARVQTLADVPGSSALAQLTRAAYYSGKAADAKTDEGAWALADAAFNSALGVPVDIPVPSTTRALQVQDADMKRIQSVRDQYWQATEQVNRALSRAAEIEQQRELVVRVTGQAQGPVAEEVKALLARLDRDLAAQRAAATAAQRGVERSASATLDMLVDFVRRRDGIAAAPDRQPEKDAYVRGMTDGSICTQRTPSYCAMLSGTVRAQCEANYENGFRVGERAKENNLREAHRIGGESKQTGKPLAFGAEHPKSGGPCRHFWVISYGSGWRGFPFTMVGR